MATQRAKLLVSGFMREACHEIDIFIPFDISELITSYYPQNFIFERHKFNVDRDKILDDGLKLITSKSDKRSINYFGEFLSAKYKNKFRCTFTMIEGGYSGVEIGFVTTEFDPISYENNTSYTKYL